MGVGLGMSVLCLWSSVQSERKSPEKISLAETSILVTNAVLCCSQFQSQQQEEHRVNRTISKLQHFANKDVSEFKPAKPVQVGNFRQ